MFGLEALKRTTIGALVFAAMMFQIGCGSSVTTVTPPPPPPSSNLIPSLQPYATPTGTVSTFVTSGDIDTTGVFFQQLGTNARSCANCHQVSEGMALNAAATQALFTSTNGADPLFLPVDGANCPTVATGDIAGHSLVLNNGLIRIAREIPANAQFQVTATADPYGCAVTTDPSTMLPIFSVYRRPLPVASLTFLSNVMWDTRDTIAPLNIGSSFSSDLVLDLEAQAASAATTHEQASAVPSSELLSELVAFVESLYTAEATDNLAGPLNSNGALGGAADLSSQNYYPGINDSLGQDPQGNPFNPVVFTLFEGFANSMNPQQASIARGENIFNTAPLTITGVRGLNDNSAIGSPPVITGTCSTCHDAPNVGNHSFPLAMDTGIAHLAASETNAQIIAGLAQLAAPDLPIYQITGCTDINNNPVTYITTDPGKGLFSGLCADVNRVKVPILRGLAARAPYFHNGSAGNLQQLVSFYNARFQMNLNPQQMMDLVNFLNAL